LPVIPFFIAKIIRENKSLVNGKKLPKGVKNNLTPVTVSCNLYLNIITARRENPARINRRRYGKPTDSADKASTQVMKKSDYPHAVNANHGGAYELTYHNLCHWEFTTGIEMRGRAKQTPAPARPLNPIDKRSKDLGHGSL
jgi:hypothetical protein